MKSLARLVVLVLALSVHDASAFTGHSGGTAHRAAAPKTAKAPKAKSEKTAKAKKPPKEKKPRADTSPTAKRDEKGRIQRSAAARHAFARQTGYPNGRPGYVIDHIVPLACGCADAPSNMQWQTVEAAKLKDKTERAGC